MLLHNAQLPIHCSIANKNQKSEIRRQKIDSDESLEPVYCLPFTVYPYAIIAAMTALLWIMGIGLIVALLYWLIVIGEGTYLGRPVVRWIYTRGANIYDQVRERVTKSDQQMLVMPLRLALLHTPFAPTLDVATGTGRVPLLLANEDWYHGRIIGLDLTPRMLEIARNKAIEAKHDQRIEWLLGSGDDLSQWQDATFGLVTCLEAVEYFPRPRRAIREMWRVLQPEGTLIISAWTANHARWLPVKSLTAQQMQAFLADLGCQHCDIRAWQPGHYDLVIAVKNQNSAIKNQNR